MTAAKEKMNTSTLTPAYLLQVNYPIQASRSRSYTFRDADLLAARQAAIQKAQRIVAEKLAHQVIDITIDLIEIDRSTVADKHPIIATVFSQRFQRTMFMKEGKDLLVDMQMDAFTKKSLPEALFLTMDLEKDDEACNSLFALWESLEALASEYQYYQTHHYDMGFGSVDLADITTVTRLREAFDPASLSAQEISEYVANVQNIMAKPAYSYTVLYDSFTYAANLINTYNQHYADENEVLCFRTDFLGRQ